MLTYPKIDPVLISIGSVNLHWYGMMYLAGFAGVWVLEKIRAKLPWSPIKPEEIEDLVVYRAMGVILGGRLCYILFYNFSEFLSNTLVLLRYGRAACPSMAVR